MPLTLPGSVVTILASGGYQAHTTLDIALSGGGPVKHFSTLAISSVPTDAYGTISYEGELRVAGSLQQSLTIAHDIVDLSVQNVDLVMGDLVTNNFAYLNGAKGKLGVVFISGATKVQVIVLEGELSNASSEDTDLKFQLVSFLSLGGPVGGWRPLMRHCAWRFKRAGCDSTDASSTCSHVFDDPVNGCVSKDPAARITTPAASNNQDSFAGFPFKSPTIAGTAITDPQGAMDGGNDYNSYIKNRGGEWEGRHQLPAESYLLP